MESKIVEAQIQPIRAEDLRIPQEADRVEPTVARKLYVPAFLTPPDIIPGTELEDDEGEVIPGTGSPVASTIRATPATLANASEIATRVLSRFDQVPMSYEGAELLTLCSAIAHYANTR